MEISSLAGKIHNAIFASPKLFNLEEYCQNSCELTHETIVVIKNTINKCIFDNTGKTLSNAEINLIFSKIYSEMKINFEEERKKFKKLVKLAFKDGKYDIVRKNCEKYLPDSIIDIEIASIGITSNKYKIVNLGNKKSKVTSSLPNYKNCLYCCASYREKFFENDPEYVYRYLVGIDERKLIELIKYYDFVRICKI